VRLARFTVRGRVQGVGFRYFVRVAARRLGLHGWVRNDDDGSVSVAAAGPPDALATFERQLREGPAGSRIEAVSRDDAQVDEALPHPFVVLP
jgi:acylphosphatase